MAVDSYARDLAAAALSGAVNPDDYAKLNGGNQFVGDQVISGSLTISGDIIQAGEPYETHAEHIYTKSDLIITREGAISALTADEVTGIQAEKYDGTNNGQLVFNSSGTARVGDVGDTQPLLTRDESSNMVDGAVLVWNGEHLRAETDTQAVYRAVSASFLRGNGAPTISTRASFVGQIYVDLSTHISYQCLAATISTYTWQKIINDSMLATDVQLGIVKSNSQKGIAVDINGSLSISPASTQQIKTKSSTDVKPITVNNLDYAVKSGLSDSKITWTTQEKAAARTLIGAGNNVTYTATSLPQSGDLVANTEYYLNETAQLTFSLPTGALGDYIFIKFDSGTTPTTITISSANYGGDIPTPIASKTYELICTWNGDEWIFSYRGY